MVKAERVPLSPQPMKVVLEMDEDTATACLAVLGRCKRFGPTKDVYEALLNVVDLKGRCYFAAIKDGCIVLDRDF